ncbi:MAG: hypothetical protein WD048_10865 [Chitinophagales bacterium]
MKKFLLFSLGAFFFALLHACSLENDIIKPNCQLSEPDLVDKWWKSNDQLVESMPVVMFRRNSTMQIKGSDDELKYSIEHCNKINVENLTQSTFNRLTVVRMTPDEVIMRIDDSEKVIFTRVE